MMDSLLELGHSVQDGDDIEQFERLLILGESACVPQIIPHFLHNKMGIALPEQSQNVLLQDRRRTP